MKPCLVLGGWFSCIHSGAGKPRDSAWRKRAFRGTGISHAGAAPRGAGCWLHFLDGDRIASFCPPCDLRDDLVGLTGSGRLTWAQLWHAG